jgi:hypothetical protein
MNGGSIAGSGIGVPASVGVGRATAAASVDQLADAGQVDGPAPMFGATVIVVARVDPGAAAVFDAHAPRHRCMDVRGERRAHVVSLTAGRVFDTAIHGSSRR